VLEEHATIRAVKLWAIGTEVGAKITQASSLQNGIDNGMDDDVTIAVAGESIFPGPNQAS
jgi:hypothetical protein